MKITITSDHVNEKPWSKNGRSGVIRTQEASAETRRFRQAIRLDLGNGEAYKPGVYELDVEDNMQVGDFGDLKFARRPTMKLIEAKPAPVAARPAA